jgi:HEPN domain-containing protein
MAERHADWLRQAKRDLEHARRAAKDGDHEWSCFAAHQGAEKAVKALYQKLGAVAWGHSVTSLLASLPGAYRPPKTIVERGKALDKHYIPIRNPNGFAQGAPMDYYTLPDAERSIQDATAVIRFCEGTLAGLGADDRDAPGRSPSDGGTPPGG